MQYSQQEHLYQSIENPAGDAGCRSFIYISIDSNGYKGSNYAEHNHPPNYQRTKRLLVLQKVKDRVLLEPTPVTRIIEDEYIKKQFEH
ncbi:unnamed protein product [Rotaria socialis]|uniref:Uncharacterized protein n=1 Tax=Rotaria socialis TaxID=392032 RepID=A0A821IGG0_9BILA|nr:unnamed protein product [Rotaria socialis]CAF4701364.1 unnamed protein product [Rotaria socialis]